MKAKDILSSKGHVIYTVKENETVQNIVAKLVDNKIGFLVVFDSADDVVGVISERDVVHKCIHQHKDPAQMKAVEIMTKRDDLISATEEDDIEKIMNTMTSKKIRHLPVFKEDQLTGIISIGDVIKFILLAKNDEIKTLTEYAFGQYPS
ncbi:MAG: CBS domain-containing protein [Bacteroidota bacterium]|nr:CBS domain-containing protein [Bacteroidota bacterium]